MRRYHSVFDACIKKLKCLIGGLSIIQEQIFDHKLVVLISSKLKPLRNAELSFSVLSKFRVKYTIMLVSLPRLPFPLVLCIRIVRLSVQQIVDLFVIYLKHADKNLTLVT